MTYVMLSVALGRRRTAHGRICYWRSVVMRQIKRVAMSRHDI